MHGRNRRRHGLFLLVWVLGGAGGCTVTGADEDGGGDDGDLSLMENGDDPDGKYDGEVADAISAQLTAKYGLRPRRYLGFFNQSNEAERRFTDQLPRTVAALNAVAAAKGYGFSFTEAEIATNFISEGGFYLLDGDIASGDHLTGFGYLGVDTFFANRSALEEWMTPSVRDGLASGQIGEETAVNELGQTVRSMYFTTIEQGIDANAMMFALSRKQAAADMAARGTSMGSALPEARFFWTTIYYNAGPAFGRDQLSKAGVNYWTQKWTSGDDPKFSRYARYNALWRTSSWELQDRLGP
jgi:hypothetical protein